MLCKSKRETDRRDLGDGWMRAPKLRWEIAAESCGHETGEKKKQELHDELDSFQRVVLAARCAGYFIVDPIQ